MVLADGLPAAAAVMLGSCEKIKFGNCFYAVNTLKKAFFIKSPNLPILKPGYY
jgi:hypothetical protein